MNHAELDARPEDSQPMEAWEILTEIVLALVTKPEQVCVRQSVTDDIVHFVIYTAPEDIGKVIGKNGDTVSILRKLLGRMAAPKGQRIVVDVFDPNRRRAVEPKAVYRRGAAA